MFQNLTLFRLSHGLAEHAGMRQAATARNLANADTPGYRAQDVVPFRDLVAPGATLVPRATRPGHLLGGGPSAAAGLTRTTDAPGDPNGNSVTLEQEMLRAVDVRRQHDRALAIYRSSLALLRSSLGR